MDSESLPFSLQSLAVSDLYREQIAELKGYLTNKNAPFGVDLLIPQVGGSARKTKSAALDSSLLVMI